MRIIAYNVSFLKPCTKNLAGIYALKGVLGRNIWICSQYRAIIYPIEIYGGRTS